MDDELRRQARSFGSVAEAYDRGRPSFPREAAEWLIGDAAGHGARAGRRHRQADRAAGRPRPRRPRDRSGRGDARRAPAPPPRHPDQRRRRRGAPDAGPLGRRGGRGPVLPLVRPRPRAAGDRPGAQARRARRPGLERPRRADPLGAQAGRIIGSQDAGPRRRRSRPSCCPSLFGFVEDATFQLWQDVNRESLQDLVLSRSNISTLDDDARAAKLAEVLAFYDDYGRGMDGMQMPYDARASGPSSSTARTPTADDEAAGRAGGRPAGRGTVATTAPTRTCC